MKSLIFQLQCKSNYKSPSSEPVFFMNLIVTDRYITLAKLFYRGWFLQAFHILPLPMDGKFICKIATLA